MEPEQSKKGGKDQSEKTENVERTFDAQSDDPAAESADQTNVERPRDDPFAVPDDTGVIARLLRDDPDAPGEKSPGEPFVPLSDITDPSDPAVSFEALDDLEAQSSDAIPTGDLPLSLSEAEVEKLVQQIVDEMAARRTSSDAASPDKLAGVVLRPIEDAGSESENTTDAVAAEAGRQPPARPRVDETARDIDRFAGGIFRRPEPVGVGNLATPPRVVVMVQLADAQALMEEDRIALAPEMAAMVQEIADARIEYAEWVKGNERRAADYRLRR